MNKGNRYTSKRKPRKCPACSSASVVSILYGMPSNEAFEKAQAGRIALGGCCITGDDPAWQCICCDALIYRETPSKEAMLAA